jgi:hypothetical protein
MQQVPVVMSNCACVEDGIVAELSTPPDEVPLGKCFHPDIPAQFVAVPAGVSPQHGWTFDGTTFPASIPSVLPPPTLQQQAGAPLAGAVSVQCTSVPALTGTYPIDQTTQTQIAGVVAAQVAQGHSLPPTGSGGTVRPATTLVIA